MKRLLLASLCLLLLFGIHVNVHATIFTEIPFTFAHYSESDLDWEVSEDDENTGSTALGFSVAIGGATYDYFDLDSNGYIELLQGASDTPTNYGWGDISDLIDSDSTSTYLLAAYDDLSSYYYDYYGYKLFSDSAVFYYDTETYADEDYDLLNNFEVILYDDGRVQWNFNYADYDDYEYDLFSGLYFGNTGTLLELSRDEIPEYKSYTIPEPATIAVLGLGALSLIRRRRNSIQYSRGQ